MYTHTRARRGWVVANAGIGAAQTNRPRNVRRLHCCRGLQILFVDSLSVYVAQTSFGILLFPSARDSTTVAASRISIDPRADKYNLIYYCHSFFYLSTFFKTSICRYKCGFLYEKKNAFTAGVFRTRTSLQSNIRLIRIISILLNNLDDLVDSPPFYEIIIYRLLLLDN